jgi:hypothetical protein
MCDKMRKLLFLMALSFIVLIPLAEGMNILYVTNSSTDDPCSSLSEIDSIFCERMEYMGYSVNVINEAHARDNSSTWNEYVDECDMIFLGSVSNGMINKSVSQDVFCGNISEKITEKALFATFDNVRFEDPEIEGCAFYPSVGLASFSYSKNNCSQKNFKIAKEGFVTQGFNVGDVVNFYSDVSVARIQDFSGNAWITVECIPGTEIGFYPVVSVVGKKVFWGLVDSKSLTESALRTFDRTVMYTLDDVYWSFETLVIPSITTVNETFWIFANVTKNEKQVEGTVNFTLDGFSGDLEYSDGLWFNKNVKLADVRVYSLMLRGYSEYGFQGDNVTYLTSGSLVVDIYSGDNFKAENPYTINAKALLNSDLYNAVLYFRLIDPSNFEILSSGTLICTQALCDKTIDNMPNRDSLILEVVAKNEAQGKYGGSFKMLKKRAVSASTDKSVYKPGELLIVEFFSETPASGVNMTVIEPDEEILASLPMNKTVYNFWGKNYSLGFSLPNGTYKLNIRYKIGEDVSDINLTFDLFTWKSYAFINKQNFYPFEISNITVGVTNSYSSTLQTNVEIDIYGPEEDEEDEPLFSKSGSIEGNDEFSTTYTIAENHPEGLSTIVILLTDSHEREQKHYLNFSVNQTELTPMLFISPTTISETTIEGRTIKKTVTIENSAKNIDITNLIIEASLNIEDFVEIRNKPTTLAAGKEAKIEVALNTRGLSVREYSGEINFYSQVGTETLYLNLKIIGDIPKNVDEQLAILDELEANVTKVEDVVDISEVLDFIGNVREILNNAKDSYMGENYNSAESRYEEALGKMNDIEPMISALYAEIPDYSSIIWTAAIAIVAIIILITFIKYWKTIKKLFKRERGEEEEEEEEEIYFEPKGGEYSPEYY